MKRVDRLRVTLFSAWATKGRGVEEARKKTAGPNPPLSSARERNGAGTDQAPFCFSRISSMVLQSMQSVAVGRASSRRTPISTPQDSQ